MFIRDEMVNSGVNGVTGYQLRRLSHVAPRNIAPLFHIPTNARDLLVPTSHRIARVPMLEFGQVKESFTSEEPWERKRKRETGASDVTQREPWSWQVSWGGWPVWDRW
jgi:hypothetical protein